MPARYRFPAATTLALLLSTATADGPQLQPGAVSLFLLEDAAVTCDQAAGTPLGELSPADRPVLTSRDILFYDRHACRFYLSAEVAQQVRDSVIAAQAGDDTPGQEPIRSRALIPVLVVADGKRAFLAAFHTEDALFGAPRVVRTAPTRPADKQDATPRWRHFEPSSVLTLSLLPPYPKSDPSDPRDGQAFLRALDREGRLDPTRLSTPRMSRKQAVAAARKSDVSSADGPWGAAARPVGDDWQVEEAVLCRDAIVTVPSVNIIGLEWVPPLHKVWLVRFAPAEGGSRPPTRSGASRPVEWCVIDDATGRTLRVNPPLYAHAFGDGDGDGRGELIVGPMSSKDEVSQVAGKHLAKVDSVTFLESVEILPHAGRAPELRFRTPMRRVWLCEGPDGSGARNKVLLSDRVPRYRGPKVVLAEDFETRRAVPANGQIAEAREIDWSRPGEYRAGPWAFSYTFKGPVEKKGLQFGCLSYRGFGLFGNDRINDFIDTPWGRMYWAGGGRQCLSSRELAATPPRYASS